MRSLREKYRSKTIDTKNCCNDSRRSVKDELVHLVLIPFFIYFVIFCSIPAENLCKKRHQFDSILFRPWFRKFDLFVNQRQ
ncbi:hypothetical protein BLOT_013074, partial [Blomia tropicalis]